MRSRWIVLTLVTCAWASLALFGSTGVTLAGEAIAPFWDTYSDTWVATDALGRSLPTSLETGPPRTNRTVGIFYFLWLGRHGEAGPFDITKILATDSDAMIKPGSPLWGPLHVPHHWGESIFGYYRSDDEGVIRKHAQMLADAGVDTVIFDVTNGPTYPESYEALFRAFSEVRRHGGRTPQVAFLCPFGDPRKVVAELWTRLYQPGLHPELWFRWQGKPLLLADPAYFSTDFRITGQNSVPVPLHPGHALGQTFKVDQPLRSVAGSFPTWNTTNAAITLTLHRESPGGVPVARQRFENITDNGWLTLPLDPPQAPGRYYLEASLPRGSVGWWSDSRDSLPAGAAIADGVSGDGDRTLRLGLSGGTNDEILSFFTFRKPQPDYFLGPTQPDMWSWLEVAPQHVFTNSDGGKEMISVGVAQNAVGGRLGSMSEADVRGRSFHHGSMDRSPGAVGRGLNFAEQWERAMEIDPPFLFVTGWNEWIAGRFNRFGGIRLPVMFVDQFDQEHSRDVEPMKGGHGDNYYYQLIAAIRRYKGIRSVPPVRSWPIQVDGSFDDWREVEPEFRDDIGDAVRRDFPGWGRELHYVNRTGRNDLVAARVSCDATNVYFYVRTRDAFTPRTDPNWMMLFINTDRNPTNGWLGYDFVVNRSPARDVAATLEKQQGRGYRWGAPIDIEYRVTSNEMELAIPRTVLGLSQVPATVDFKWTDNLQQTGDWSDFTLNGDAAPNDRFNYRAVFE